MDEELEPEDQECEGKYGEINFGEDIWIPRRTWAWGSQNIPEFKQIESAIKAPGRPQRTLFFGGREVQASFYEVEKFTIGVLR